MQKAKVNRKLLVWLMATFFLATVSLAQAQQPSKVPKIGFLVLPSRSFFANRIESFQQGLHSLGYVEGKNIVIEYRYAEGTLDRLPELAKELVDVKVDVIVTSSVQGVLAAKNATRTIPIVFAAVNDPVASRLVDSLAMPGGNVTGLSILAPELGGKRLELLKETVSRIARVAFLFGSGSQGASALTVKETQAAARALGLQCQSIEVRDSKGFDSAFEAATKDVPRPSLRVRVLSSTRTKRVSSSLLQRTGYQQCTRHQSSWMLAA